MRTEEVAMWPCFICGSIWACRHRETELLTWWWSRPCKSAQEAIPEQQEKAA